MKRATIPAIADNAVLTKEELCAALQISEDMLEALVREKVIPCARLTDRLPRFIYGQVVRALERLAEAATDGPGLRRAG